MATGVARSVDSDVSSNEPATPPRREQLQRRSIFLLLILAVSYTLYFARALFFPMVLAMVLAMLFRPIIRRLRRWRVPEPVSAAGVLIFMIGLVAFGGTQLSGPAIRWARSAPESLAAVENRLRSLRQPIEEFTKATKQVEEITNGGEDEPVEVQVKQPPLTNAVLSTTGSIVAGTVVTLVLLYFLLATGDRLLNNILQTLPTFREKKHLVEAVYSVERGISAYLLTVTTINVCLGIVIGAAMWQLGLPNPVLWGVMAAALNFIPYVGAMLGATIVFLVALLSFETVDLIPLWAQRSEFSTIGYSLLAPLAYWGINALEGMLITPAILGRSMSLNPILVFVSLTFWGWMWGVGGALLAVPLLAICKIICEQYEPYQSVAKVLDN